MDLSTVIFVSLVIASSLFGNGYGQNGNFNVLGFGATGNGRADDSQAFLKAWKTTCGAVGGTQTLHIPRGKKFLVKPLAFPGPCKSSHIVIQVDGILVAPSSTSEWTGYCESRCWLSFTNVKGLSIQGTGLIDGKGSIWWTRKSQLTDYAITEDNCEAPAALNFRYCDNLQLKGFTSLNSPNKHIIIHGSTGVSISDVHIAAPENSPNTDGIVLSGTTQVNIYRSVIRTGDDCIAIKSGSSFINITRVLCGPGHGISVGSLGQKPDDKVEEVHVRSCNFYKAQNGARIKTVPGGSGYVKAISFKNIILRETRNPIIIDQQYHEANKAVHVSDITFGDFRGTSATDQAIILNCAQLGCSNIVMDHVNIKNMVPGKATLSVCKNASGKKRFTIPDVPCLSK